MKVTGKTMAFWPIMLTVFLADCSTKAAVVANLDPHDPVEVIGDVARLNLTFNTNAALGISVGPNSAMILSTVGAIMIALLLMYYRRLPKSAVGASVALAFLLGGAIGNVVDRMAGHSGVVDFIDLGLGTTRFWTFNIADVAICFGAALMMFFSRNHHPMATMVAADSDQ